MIVVDPDPLWPIFHDHRPHALATLPETRGEAAAARAIEAAEVLRCTGCGGVVRQLNTGDEFVPTCEDCGRRHGG